MSVRIDQTKCVGCGRCCEACPGNLLHLDEHDRAVIRDVRDCWGCTSCMKECPAGAIGLFLGADIGGRGAVMHIRKHGAVYDWIIDKPDGSETVISVDRRSANAY